MIPPLQLERQPGGDEDHALGDRGQALVQAPCLIDEAAREVTDRNNTLAYLVRDKDDRAHRTGEASEEAAAFLDRLAPGKQQVRQPKRKAVDEDGSACCRVNSERLRQRQRLLDEQPTRPTLPLVMLDPRPHLDIERLGCGDVDRGEPASQDEGLGEGALAGAHTAQNECEWRQGYDGGLL
jgi:hypothetical protein